MDCPNCKATEAVKLITVPDEEGGTFCFCNLCPRPKPKEMNFPAIIVKGKRGRGRPRKIESKDSSRDFEKYRLTPEQIAKTQSLRPGVVMSDTLRSRDLDDRDLVMRGKRAIVYCGGTGERRNMVARKKVIEQLGTENFKVLKDDGTKIIAQAIN